MAVIMTNYENSLCTAQWYLLQILKSIWTFSCGWSYALQRELFSNNILSNIKHCGIKIYELYNMSSYTNDMTVYLGKDKYNATKTMAAT